MHTASSVFRGLEGHACRCQQKWRACSTQPYEETPTLPKILQDFDSKDTRVSSLAMESFILLWQPEKVDTVCLSSFGCTSLLPYFPAILSIVMQACLAT